MWQDGRYIIAIHCSECSIIIQQLNLNLTRELEDYRHQTKSLMSDLRVKEEEIVSLREKISSNEVSQKLARGVNEGIFHAQMWDGSYKAPAFATLMTDLMWNSNVYTSIHISLLTASLNQ